MDKTITMVPGKRCRPRDVVGTAGRQFDIVTTSCVDGEIIPSSWASRQDIPVDQLLARRVIFVPRPLGIRRLIAGQRFSASPPPPGKLPSH
ncbi:hypothetical protein BDW62DRAFT_193433 [Aspergillus aurantiobrunneus]